MVKDVMRRVGVLSEEGAARDEANAPRERPGGRDGRGVGREVHVNMCLYTCASVREDCCESNNGGRLKLGSMKCEILLTLEVQIPARNACRSFSGKRPAVTFTPTDSGPNHVCWVLMDHPAANDSRAH